MNQGYRVELLKLRILERAACRAKTQPSVWGTHFSADVGVLQLRGGAMPSWKHRPLERGHLGAEANAFDDGMMHLLVQALGKLPTGFSCYDEKDLLLLR